MLTEVSAGVTPRLKTAVAFQGFFFFFLFDTRPRSCDHLYPKPRPQAKKKPPQRVSSTAFFFSFTQGPSSLPLSIYFKRRASVTLSLSLPQHKSSSCAPFWPDSYRISLHIKSSQWETIEAERERENVARGKCLY